MTSQLIFTDEVYNDNETMANGTLESEDFRLLLEDLPPSIYGIVSVVGFLTNCALLFVMPRTNVREAPNGFVLSLALADLLVVAFVLPIETYAFDTPLYPFHVGVCKMTEGLSDIGAGVTAFSLPALVAYCLLDGRESTLPSGKAKWNVAVAVIWALAVLFAVPSTITTQLYPDEENNVTTLMCLVNDPMSYDLTISLKFAIYVATPLCAAGYFYGIARGKGLTHVGPNVQGDFSRAALALVVVYAICFVPDVLVVLLTQIHYQHYNNVWHILSIASNFMTLVYRCLNPIVLYYASVDFRRLFHRHVFLWCPLSDDQSLESGDQRPLQGST